MQKSANQQPLHAAVRPMASGHLRPRHLQNFQQPQHVRYHKPQKRHNEKAEENAGVSETYADYLPPSKLHGKIPIWGKIRNKTLLQQNFLKTNLRVNECSLWMNSIGPSKCLPIHSKGAFTLPLTQRCGAKRSVAPPGGVIWYMGMVYSGIHSYILYENSVSTFSRNPDYDQLNC
ncbi:hypothetical protein DAPPUDRAFT_120085 [Daphnia pulex]|uniref:Uncharacterized protein n=1 Tax=Daphnia pulex TaxID=6669 RepID=E9I087_DAPPU|nr:hypothetical protein DAPPUDRAFT_120085 [Daphnia pulex]|eukprot:EFX62594.1 hypothetical protein DAPPUDRAFT_120085 [Daphnia pulex]